MKKPINKILMLCLVLALLLAAFPVSAFAAETAGHTHDYEVTTSTRYSYVDDNTHVLQEVHTHTCDCGAQYMEHHNLEVGAHIAKGSGTFAYSFETISGDVIDYYRYTCKLCSGSYVQAR